MNERNVETLLVKLVGEMKSLNAEVRGLRAELRKRAGEPEPVEIEKKKPWASVTSVTRNHLTHETVSDDPAVPSALTDQMRKAADAQKRQDSNPKSVETFKADAPESLRLSDENLRRGGWR